jgi:Flp pilus assembly pilin Flp
MPQPHTRRHQHLSNESGQTLTEYSLLVVLIAVAIAVLLPGLATALNGFFSDAAAAFGA